MSQLISDITAFDAIRKITANPSSLKIDTCDAKGNPVKLKFIIKDAYIVMYVDEGLFSKPISILRPRNGHKRVVRSSIDLMQLANVKDATSSSTLSFEDIKLCCVWLAVTKSPVAFGITDGYCLIDDGVGIRHKYKLSSAT